MTRASVPLFATSGTWFVSCACCPARVAPDAPSPGAAGKIGIGLGKPVWRADLEEPLRHFVAAHPPFLDQLVIQVGQVEGLARGYTIQGVPVQERNAVVDVLHVGRGVPLVVAEE